MWLHVIKKRAGANAARSCPVTPESIAAAEHVLFAVFGRYGDSIIAFKTIDQFIRRFPDKRYTLITTRQACPYARAVVRGECAFHGINKRRDPLALWKLVRELKRRPPDLGFNPWSHGEDGEFFVSYCKQFHYYSQFAKFTRDANLYARAREYLLLPADAVVHRAQLPTVAQQMVVSPFSTDLRKSLGPRDLAALLTDLEERYHPRRIVIAGFPDELAKLDNTGVGRFAFIKSAGCSTAFLKLLRDTDLFVGVDAGPLHLADALGIPAVGLFGPTAPETILDVDSGIVPLRHGSLDGIFCDVRQCQDPLCMHALRTRRDLDVPVAVQFDRRLVLESEHCRYRPDTDSKRQLT